MRRVKLNKAEMHRGSRVGAKRQVEALFRPGKDKHGMDPEDGWANQIEGACAELAFCKAFGLIWEETCNTFKSRADVGETEVRMRRYTDKYPTELIVRSDD